MSRTKKGRRLEFLWEVGVEEIPAAWLPALIEELRDLVSRELLSLGLTPAHVGAFGTPRRLVVHVPELAERQKDRTEQVTGPPLKIAKDAGGAWSKAALGFAAKNEIAPEELLILSTPKGEYVGFERKTRGRKTIGLLPEVMAAALRGLRFPKFMNWDASLADGKGAFPFGRPIRWMVSLYGGKVVPFEIAVAGAPPVESGRKTRGHRFLGPRRGKAGAPFAVSSFAELDRRLRKHFVILDPEKRRRRLSKEIAKLEKKANARRARGLEIDLVADLVEWPGAVLSSYPEEFMALPEEVRHTVLIHHQHYFPLEARPAFIAVTNMAKDPQGHIARGAERVVAARLRDAKFFWDDDLRTPLEDRTRALDGVLFHDKLGSYRAKTNRIVPLAAWIALQCGAREGAVRRAAALAKCDLVTGMVREFPELQGIMGGLYGREQGEPEAVWRAIYSHYQPVGLGEDDGFPANREGAVLSLADKIDTLAAMFAAGAEPTGSRDPFALRRAALGAARVLRESGSRLSFPIPIAPEELLGRALRVVREQGVAPHPNAEKNLREFFTERLRYVFWGSYRYDELNAVFALGPLDRPVADLEKRLEAVAASSGSEDFVALSAAFKRVSKILVGQKPGEIDPAFFFEEHEKELFQALESVRPEVEEQTRGGRYREAIQRLSTLRKPVDRFFDEVLVMAEDEKLRRNRLALLKSLRNVLSQVADLSQIVSESGT
jgi:glycyl-tRNA synthetase beta chain